MAACRFQGTLKSKQIEEGESLAQSALASELLVCKVAGLTNTETRKHTGRSQYPRFTRKPIVKMNVYEEARPHLQYWSVIKQLTTHTQGVP